MNIFLFACLLKDNNIPNILYYYGNNIILFFKGLLGDRQSKDVSIHKDNKTPNVSTAPKPWTLIEIQENISRLPMVKHMICTLCTVM